MTWDTAPMADPFDVAVGYAIAKHGVSLSMAETLAKQHFDEQQAPPDATERELVRKIRAAMQTFRAEKGRDPERLQVIGKADIGMDSAKEPLGESKTTGESFASTESRLAALTTATARELTNKLATRAHARDPSRPFAWHLGRIFETRPELYESENQVSDLASRRRYATTPSDMGLDSPRTR
jgi:hypothetical protein